MKTGDNGVRGGLKTTATEKRQRKQRKKTAYANLLKKAQADVLNSQLRPVELQKANCKISKRCKIGFEEITPQKALKMLQSSNNLNRALSYARARQIARDIVAGRWHPEVPDVICIGEDGNIKSAQHRLLAIVIAKTPVQCLVMRNCPDSAWKVIDSGRPRRSCDNMKMAGQEEANARIESTIKHMLDPAGRLHGFPSMQETQDILDYYWEAALFVEQHVIGTGRNPKRVFMAPVLGVIAKAWYTCLEDGDENLGRLGDFISVLADGQPVGRSSEDRAAMVLRDWLTVGKGATLSNRRDDKIIIYWTTMNALKKFLDKEELLRARQTSVDFFPIPEYKKS